MWPWRQQSKTVTQQLWWCTTIPNLVAKGSTIQEIWKKQLIFLHWTPYCDPDLEDRNPTFLHDTVGRGYAPSYHVWLHTVQWFRRYLPDKSVTGGQMDNLIPQYTTIPNLCDGGDLHKNILHQFFGVPYGHYAEIWNISKFDCAKLCCKHIKVGSHKTLSIQNHSYTKSQQHFWLHRKNRTWRLAICINLNLKSNSLKDCSFQQKIGPGLSKNLIIPWSNLWVNPPPPPPTPQKKMKTTPPQMTTNKRKTLTQLLLTHSHVLPSHPFHTCTCTTKKGQFTQLMSNHARYTFVKDLQRKNRNQFLKLIGSHTPVVEFSIHSQVCSVTIFCLPLTNTYTL